MYVMFNVESVSLKNIKIFMFRQLRKVFEEWRRKK